MAHSEHDSTPETKRALAKKVDAVGWGLFLIWIGIAFLANVGWGVGLLGVGTIALGAQPARVYLGLPTDRFGLVFGIVFVVWGAWELLKMQLGETPIPGSLFPILFIVVGLVLVVAALRKPRQ